MPIKFRCQHCQQLLGISRSQAGAVVDCPQCGRDLRVPELDGKTRSLPKTRTVPQNDSGLLSALAELSEFDNALPQQEPAQPNTNPRRTQFVANPVVSVGPVDAFAPVAVNLSPRPAVALHPGESETEDIADHLSELAALPPSQQPAEVSETLLDEMRSVSHPVGMPAAAAIAGAGLLAVGLIAGWYLGRAHDARQSVVSTVRTDPDSLPADKIANRARKPVIGSTVTGTVRYRDAAGRLAPDAGCIVLILPLNRQRELHGELKLDGQSLRLPIDDPDRVATTLALESLAAACTTVEADGTFAASVPSTDKLLAVVVSRHCQRQIDKDVDDGTTHILEQWFTAPQRVYGKLAVRTVNIGAGNTAGNILFTDEE